MREIPFYDQWSGKTVKLRRLVDILKILFDWLPSETVDERERLQTYLSQLSFTSSASAHATSSAFDFLIMTVLKDLLIGQKSPIHWLRSAIANFAVRAVDRISLSL